MSGANHTRHSKKAHLRKEIITIRNQLGFSARMEKDEKILNSLQHLTEISTAEHIFCYISLGAETDTHILINWLLEQNKQVFVPKIIGSKEIIAVAFPGWTHLHAGPYGIFEPESSRDESAKVDICITPGVCFDKNGNRLGHGIGYYDKWLGKYSVRDTIAPTYDCQVLDTIPVDKHDKKMGLIVTESRVIRA